LAEHGTSPETIASRAFEPAAQPTESVRKHNRDWTESERRAIGTHLRAPYHLSAQAGPEAKAFLLDEGFKIAQRSGARATLSEMAASVWIEKVTRSEIPDRSHYASAANEVRALKVGVLSRYQ
jgi:hypothetical protein